MKQIIVTDVTTELSKVFLSQYNIVVISSNKSPLGQISYTLDTLTSSGFDIVYLSSKKGYASVCSVAKMIASIHPTNNIHVIDIESSPKFGKNNASLRIAESEDTESAVSLTQCESLLLKEETFDGVSISV